MTADAEATRAYFQRLGSGIEEAWARVLYDERKFGEIAEEALRASPPQGVELTPESIARWAMETDALIQQPNAEVQFGEPPITMFCGRRFYIEALFWLDGTTSIHQHGFDGAFCVLHGGSIHSTYDFKERASTSGRILIGDLVFRHAEWLKPGAVRRIDSGPTFIHALFHLARPSVSIVVRTYGTLRAAPQYSYSPPHLANYPFDSDLWGKRMLQYLAAILSAGIVADPAAFVRDMFARADDASACEILASLCIRRAIVEGEKLNDDGDTSAVDARIVAMHAAAIDAARAKFGEHADEIILSSERSAQLRTIALLRQRVHRDDHRTFLALLMNVPDRKRIIELVGEMHPEAEPVEWLIGAIRELTDDPKKSMGYVLEPDSLRLVECVVRGYRFERTLEVLSRAVGRKLEKEEVAAVRAELAELAELPLLRPLFSDADLGATVSRSTEARAEL
jgi:hypothetical protein